MEISEVPIILPSLKHTSLGKLGFNHSESMVTRFSFPQLSSLTSMLEGEKLNQIILLLKNSAPNFKTHTRGWE